MFSLQTFTRGCFTVFSVIIAIELLQTGEAGVGVLTAGFGAGAVLGSFVAAAILVGNAPFARWTGVAVALWGAPFVAMAAVHSVWPAIALLAVVGIANALIDAAAFTLLQLIVPDEVMGRFFASLESLFTLTVAIGSIAAPLLIVVFGERGALVAAGLVGPIGAVLAWPTLRRLDLRLEVGARVIALLQRVGFLAPLPLATLARLAAQATGRDVQPGSVVVEEGQTGDDFYVIATGHAEVLSGDETVRELDAGDCFGEIAALRHRPRTASVRATTEMQVLQLSGDHLVWAVSGYTPSRAVADALV
jgi:MFS family permease